MSSHSMSCHVMPFHLISYISLFLFFYFIKMHFFVATTSNSIWLYNITLSWILLWQHKALPMQRLKLKLKDSYSNPNSLLYLYIFIRIFKSFLNPLPASSSLFSMWCCCDQLFAKIIFPFQMTFPVKLRVSYTNTN